MEFWGYGSDLKKIKRKQQIRLSDLLRNTPIYKIYSNPNNMGFIAKELMRLSGEDVSGYILNKACVFAKDKYTGIKRKDDNSMFSHAQTVAKILKRYEINNKYI